MAAGILQAARLRPRRAPASRQSRFELVADLLIESREEPALVGGGIESREVRFV